MPQRLHYVTRDDWPPATLRLRYWRQKRELTLKDAEALTGVRYQILSELERHRQTSVPAVLLPVFAKAYCVKVEDLFEPSFLCASPCPCGRHASPR